MIDRSKLQVTSSRLVDLVAGDPRFMARLRVVRSLGLDAWCIGAGAVRDLVWDRLSGRPSTRAPRDVDVAYFDAADVDPGSDVRWQRRLLALAPFEPWEVTNQAMVHRWFEACFGHAVDPLVSLEDAVASWPEYATAVGVTLKADDTIEVIAPHGLDDLFAMVVRRNPTRVSVETYRQRVATKRYAARWPEVRVIAC